MSRWHHGHSILVGVLIAALLARHLIWTLSLTFALGVLVGRSWWRLARLLRWAGQRLPLGLGGGAPRFW